MQVRPADSDEIDLLARLWCDGWHETHAPLSPLELICLRSLASFRDRLQAALPNVYVVGPVGAPLGFCSLKGEELYQLFVSPEAHGSGVAAALIADAEARLVKRGVETAWLACAVGNYRAARFYEKSGWHIRHFVADVERSFSGGTVALRKTAHSLNVSIGEVHRKLPLVAPNRQKRAAEW
jgi:ribosomal protein S18 acetylase RimI-like enzyme